MTKDEALDLALEALEEACEIVGAAWTWRDEKGRPAITAIKQARALDKMAENARELGLDYEPAPMSQPNRAIAYAAASKLRELGYEWVTDAWKQPAQQEPVKLWLWKNFVKGRPEYWAFDNPFPCLTVNGDPLTFGEPCGWAFLKPSVNGRPERSEQEVINTITRLADTSPPARQRHISYACPQCHWSLEEQPAQRTWVGLTNEEIVEQDWRLSADRTYEQWTLQEQLVVCGVKDFARAIEAKLKEKNA